MNISFKCRISPDSEFIDFLLAFLEPDKIDCTPSFTEPNYSITGSRLITIEELENQIHVWADKHKNDTYVGFHLISVELTEEEKKKIKETVVFQHALH